jgi:esterase
LQLHIRTHGDGAPVVLLHGLLGSNENLGGIARGLGGEYGLIGMDLRNHGRSPHGTPMDYATMAGDVRTALQAEGIQQARMVGHSMGGKVAMELALGSPEWVERLVVLDIAPIAYERRHDATLEALHGLEPVLGLLA